MIISRNICLIRIGISSIIARMYTIIIHLNYICVLILRERKFFQRNVIIIGNFDEINQGDVTIKYTILCMKDKLKIYNWIIENRAHIRIKA